MTYQISFTKTSQKQLKNLPKPVQKVAIDKIAKLAENPRPSDYKKLKARDGYRVRIGNYRILYTINDKLLIILIVDIDHRKQAYR